MVNAHPADVVYCAGWQASQIDEERGKSEPVIEAAETEVDAEVSVGAWLSQQRAALGLTQKEVAHYVGCSVSAIRKFETDSRRPSVQVAERMAEVLAVPATVRPLFLRALRGEVRLERFIAALASAQAAAHSPRALATDWMISHLPSLTVPTVGRERERAHLVQLLTDPQCRLLTLCGLGGIGKTHLALQTAHDVSSRFADGAYFVSLAPITDIAHVVPTLARTLGVGMHSAIGLERQLLAFLRGKELLLVLDNMEHLLAQGVDDLGRFLAKVIQEAPGVKLFITSRERLHLHGEWVFELYGLPVPLQAGDLALFDATALFLTCAKRVDARFLPDAENQAAIVRICRLLEGMPLAIELAAAWTALLPCTKIADEIESNIDFLTTMRRDVPPRHRSVRAAFDASWRLLSAEEQQLLSKLALFRSGFTREAAQAVAGASLPSLLALLAKSLIQRDGSDRFTLHELLRQYSLEQLPDEARAETWQAFAVYYRALVRAAGPEINGPRQLFWLDRLEQELGNLRAVLGWAVESGEVALGLEIAGEAQAFWSQRDLHGEGRHWLAALLNDAPPESMAPESTVVVTAHLTAAFLAYEQNKLVDALRWLERLLPYLSTYTDPNIQQNVWRQLGAVTLAQGEYDSARMYLEKSLAWIELHEPQSIAHAVVLTWLGDLFHLLGEDEQAVAHFAQGTALFRQRGSKNHLAYALRHWSWALIRQGNLADALSLCRESLLLNLETQSELGMIGCVACVAAVLAARQEIEPAIQLAGAVEGLLQELGLQLRPLDQFEYTATLDSLRQRVEPARYACVWREGLGWTRAQVLAAIETIPA